MCAIWEGVFRTFLQTIEVRNRFYQLSPRLRAHFVVGGRRCLACWPGQGSEFARPLLRVVSHQAAIDELTDRAGSRVRNRFDPVNETPQDDDLRFSSSLLPFALESNELDGIEVDSEKRVVDRSRQVALVPPPRAEQLVEAN